MPSPAAPGFGTVSGAVVTASLAFILAWLVHWARSNSASAVGGGRIAVVVVVVKVFAAISYAYMRRQWLQHLRQQTLAEASEFVSKAQEFDAVAAGALNLVQEVELVSRGYRM